MRLQKIWPIRQVKITVEANALKKIDKRQKNCVFFKNETGKPGPCIFCKDRAICVYRWRGVADVIVD